MWPITRSIATNTAYTSPRGSRIFLLRFAVSLLLILTLFKNAHAENHSVGEKSSNAKEEEGMATPEARPNSAYRLNGLLSQNNRRSAYPARRGLLPFCCYETDGNLYDCSSCLFSSHSMYVSDLVSNYSYSQICTRGCFAASGGA
eukprot:gb/GECG01015994.1/.p1 GENE.gb/GECG01015994.1/~~gb/GECG01015994.1/.p1  ORF type:complete len:145 (+),score=5.56 gb/GECG01015994.1/:1-435(+)